MNISVIKGQTVNFHGNGRKLWVMDAYGKSGFRITNHNYFMRGIHNSQICRRLHTTKIIVPGYIATYKENKKEGK